MNWDQTLTKIEDTYGHLIILVGVIMMVVVMVMLGYIVMTAEGCTASDCTQMMLSDTWDNGYVFDIAKECQSR